MPDSAHNALRAATNDAHERVDALFSRFDLTDRAGYARFLAAHHAVVAPVEAMLDAAGAADILPDWPDRRRSAALEADRAALPDTPALPDPEAAPHFAEPAEIWGAAYVLEGSRLGGRFIARGVPHAFPTAYLTHEGAPGGWRDFTAALDKAIDLQPARSDAIRSASVIFNAFVRSAERYL